MDEDPRDDILPDSGPSDPGAAGASAKRAWWLLSLGALAGAFALNTPKVRRMLTVSDVTTGRTPEYPELQPQVYPDPMERVFSAAVRACEELRWMVDTEDRLDRRIHAEVPVPPGLIDDFDIWITDTEEGRVVMARSHARIGRGDLGVNARHILHFQRRMARLLPPEVAPCEADAG